MSKRLNEPIALVSILVALAAIIAVLSDFSQITGYSFRDLFIESDTTDFDTPKSSEDSLKLLNIERDE